MTLSIVILSYNTKDLIIKCVSTLKKQFDEELKKDNLEIIIVDNASKKDVVDRIEKEISGLKNIKLLKNKENLGFGKGSNLGVKYSKGEYVLFLNSDTQIEDKGFLGMVDYMRKNTNVGILGGRLLNADGSPQASAGKFYGLFNFFLMMIGGERFGFLKSSPSKNSRVDWVSGACFMVNKNIFEKIGGFDKNIFMYMEDMEFCLRARKNGFLTYYYSNVKVFHKELGSSDRSFAVVNIYKGILYYFKIHKTKPEYEIVRFFLRLKARVVYLLGKFTNNSYYIKTYGQALKIFK